MKKLLCIALALVMVFGIMTACANKEPAPAAPATTAPAAEAPAADATAPAAEPINWPEQPVNIMCPASAGGGTDMMLRLWNEYFTAKTGQPFVITNVSGVAGYEQVYQANPDGYNFICGTTTIFTSELDGTFAYDWDDYEMVAFHKGDYGTCIAVQADSPYKTINDLLDAAKADPSAVTGGITLSGQPYMFALALKDAVGIDLYFVDTGNTGERNAALLGGQVDYIITNSTSVAGYVASGDFRILAIDGPERFELMPDIPTFVEQGVDFVFAGQPMVWLAPKGTPAEVCEAFNAILAEIYADPDCRDAFREKMTMILPDPLPSVEESKVLGQEFKDLLAPYVSK